MHRIVITRTERDHLAEEAAGYVEGLSEDLGTSLRYARERGDAREAPGIDLGQLSALLRLLDEIGWEDEGDKDHYNVAVTAGLCGFLQAERRTAEEQTEWGREDVELLPAETRRLSKELAASMGMTEDEMAEREQDKGRQRLAIVGPLADRLEAVPA